MAMKVQSNRSRVDAVSRPDRRRFFLMLAAAAAGMAVARYSRSGGRPSAWSLHEAEFYRPHDLAG